MRRLVPVLVALVAATVVGAASPSGRELPAFRGSVSALSPAVRQSMTGVSWRPGCPVGLDELRLVRARYVGMDGRAHTGRIVVQRDVATEVVAVLRRLYASRFPIRRMVPVDAYGGSDYRSIEADNTSAFNCRYVDGTTRWSEHAYGRAIDLNPIENPYVTAGGTTSHPASRSFLRRAPYRPGMAVEGGAVVRAFDAVGWGWGGRWSGARDYQHFSASGR
jgi:hypothetical protein